MQSSTHVRREPAPKKPRTRAVWLTVRPDGAIYGYVVEITSVTPRRERTIEWLGRSPSVTRIQRAARQWRASLPGASTDVE